MNVACDYEAPVQNYGKIYSIQDMTSFSEIQIWFA